jgi:hypothetical protein
VVLSLVLALSACRPERPVEPSRRPVPLAAPRDRLLGTRTLSDVQAQHLNAVAEHLGVTVEEAARRGPADWLAAGVEATVVAGAWSSAAYRAAARQVGAAPPAEPADAAQLVRLPGASRAPDLDCGGLRAYRSGGVEAWVGPGLVLQSDRDVDFGRMILWLGGAETPFDPDGMAWLAGHWIGDGAVVDADAAAALAASVPGVDVPGGARTVETGDVDYRFWWTDASGTRPMLVVVPAQGRAILTRDAAPE